MIEQTDLLVETSVAAPVPVLDVGADSNRVIQKAKRAGKALILRQIFVYAANIGGSVVLARLLPADQYGYYGIALFAVMFLAIFGGTGFAANLIRMNDEPAKADFEVLFTAQQAIVLAIFVAAWFISPKFATIYHMGPSGVWFFRMIGGSLVLTSFMVMPQIKMERELAFDRLAVVEVFQAIGFNVSAIVFALKGAGALSFSGALMVRSGIGAVLAHISFPWKFGLRWDFNVLKKHLHYGVALQTGQFVGMLKDSISPLFVGIMLGAADVGYVTWASALAAYAVWILMPIQRLYLPLFARLQNDPAKLKSVVEYVLWLLNVLAAPLTLITLALSRPITILIFGTRWLDALPLYYFFCFGNLFSPCSTPMLGVLNALGESRKTLYISIIWMVTIWLLGVPLTWWLGLKGFGLASAGLYLTNLVLYWMVWRVTHISAWAAYLPSWPISVAVAVALVLVQVFAPIHHLTGLILYGVVGVMLYVAVFWYGFPNKARGILRIREIQS